MKKADVKKCNTHLQQWIHWNSCVFCLSSQEYEFKVRSMRNRGKIYWEWANSTLHSRNYDERLPCGTLINIQARLSLENVTQLFLGIYGKKGVLLLEEVHPDCRGQKLSAAMVWALERAHDWVAKAFPAPKAPGPEPLPRRGSRLHG